MARCHPETQTPKAGNNLTIAWHLSEYQKGYDVAGGEGI